MRQAGPALALLALASGGCHLLVGHEPTGTPTAEGGPRDLAPHELARTEAGPGDGGPGEIAPHDLVREQRPDLPLCADGTPLWSCSQQKPLRCGSSLQLEHDCPTCNCPGFQKCNTATKACAPVTVTLIPTADSYVVEGTDKNTNFGGAQEIKVGRFWEGRRDILIDFDLATIPIAATIDSATLQLVVVGWADKQYVSATLALAAATWAESTVTWNNAPSTLATPTASKTFGFGLHPIDVKPLVDVLLASKPAHGIRITSVTTDQYNVSIASREYNPDPLKRPKLTITYR